MKWRWSETELAALWFLSKEEIALLGRRSGSGRLGLAVLLKFFQREGRFPASGKDIPTDIVKYVAQQAGVDFQEMAQYDWEGRTAKRQRTEVLSWLGFRRFRLSDRTALQTWLRQEVLPLNPPLPQLQEQQSKPRSNPVVGQYLGVIAAWLEADESAPPKQRHTAHRIWERLCEEYGFTGSERRIREVVAALRQKGKESYLPLGFEPGEMAQMDWIEDMRAE